MIFKTANGRPRRYQVELQTSAEQLIRSAMAAVEGLPGDDKRLTEAVVLLNTAREKVADYVDDKLGEGPRD